MSMRSGFLTELVRAIGKGKVIVSGRFRPNGSSAIDNTKNVGKGWQVAYTSTGLYTITFDKNFDALQDFRPELWMGTPATAHETRVGVYTAASRTITISQFTSGSLADIASDANNWISFTAVFKNTAAPG